MDTGGDFLILAKMTLRRACESQRCAPFALAGFSSQCYRMCQPLCAELAADSLCGRLRCRLCAQFPVGFALG